MKKTKVYMGIPSTGTRSDPQCYALRDIEKMYADTIEFVYPENCVHRMFHDFARNAIVEDFLASDCDVLWFLDSDIVPHTKVITALTEHYDKWLVAGAPYPVFMTPSKGEGPAVVMCVYEHDGNKLYACDVPSSGEGFVAGLATGCLFIKREAFSMLEKPYFEFKFDETTRNMTEGEDLGFCRKLHNLGIKFYINFDYPASHYKTVNLLDVNNYAVQFAQKSVAQYDAQIRPQVAALSERYKALLAQTKGKRPSGLIIP